MLQNLVDAIGQIRRTLYYSLPRKPVVQHTPSKPYSSPSPGIRERHCCHLSKKNISSDIAELNVQEGNADALTCTNKVEEPSPGREPSQRLSNVSLTDSGIYATGVVFSIHIDGDLIQMLSYYH